MSEYLKMVQTLAKPGDQILASLTPEKCHMLHMAIGIVGEVAELMEPMTATYINRMFTIHRRMIDSIEFVKNSDNNSLNLIEEFGDIWFYFVGLVNEDELDQQFENLDPNGSYNFVMKELITSSGALLDQVKKYVVYNKPYHETKIPQTIVAFKSAYLNALRHCWIHPRVIRQYNMTKLAERYKGFQYSDASAQARADKGGQD